MNRSVLLVVLLVGLSSCASQEPIIDPAGPDTSILSVSEEHSDSLALLASVQDDQIPLDPLVKVDTLDNGLTYFIRANKEPQNRAELRLVVNAGSLLEEDDQLGVAHFVEHMLFNGTERFEKSELVDFLERTGMRFGADVNAYTSFDETVYMLTIPTDSADIFETSFDILEDWAAYATLDPEEIDKERGVVIEEWRRSTQNAGGRIQKQTLPVLLHESRYENRLPIGDTTILKNADYEVFERYYRDWYRPNLMAVVAVGDFDVDEVEQKIIAHFSSLTNPEEPIERTSFDVPGHEETLYAIVTDPEYPFSTVQTYYKRSAEEFETIDQYKNLIVGRFFTSMLNKRLAEISRRPEPPFVGASVSKGSLVRTSGFHSMGAQVQDDGVLSGLESLLVEAKRIRDHGFTATELDRQKRQTLRAYLRAFNEREKTSSESHASEYVSLFLEGVPAPGIEYEYELVQEILPGLTVDQINALASEFLATRNRVIIVTMPEKEGLFPPTEIELSSIFDKVETMTVEPWVDETNDQPLLADVPSPGLISETKEIEELGITEITLENGIRIAMKSTDFKEDEIRFVASSPGGSSLATDDAYFAASNASMLVGRSGVGTFDVNELQKALADKVVGASPYISEFSEGFRGAASPDDIEVLFQLIHLYVTQSRVDSSALTTFQNQLRAYIPNRASTPQGVFGDSLIAFLYGDHPRMQFPTLEMVESLDIEAAHAFYEDRFADMSDFVFTFVGNLEVEALSELAQTYLGNLPSSNRDETWLDSTPRLPEGDLTLVVRKGLADQAQVSLTFHGPIEYNRINRHRMRSLVDVLNIKLREELREELGGVYSVNARSSVNNLPEPTYQVDVSFGCDPERVNELVDAVIGQVKVLKEEGATEEEIGKIKEQQRRGRETQKETNAFWVSVIDFYNTHPEEDIMDVLTYEEMIESITTEDVKNMASKAFVEDRLIKAVLLPESHEGSIDGESAQ